MVALENAQDGQGSKLRWRAPFNHLGGENVPELSASDAWELERKGKSVIVNCSMCGAQVWTDKAIYDGGEWFCDECKPAGRELRGNFDVGP